MSYSRNHHGRLSERALRRLRVGSFQSENLGYGRGSLEARRTGTGVRFYYRQGSGQKRVPIRSKGDDDQMSLEEARERAIEMSGQAGSGKLLGERSFGDLLTSYVDHLREHGKNSANDTRSLLRRHIRKAFPRLWFAPASSIAGCDIVMILDRVADDGHLATAVKLRGILHAAFSAALTADYNVQARTLRGFGLTKNPVALVPCINAGRQAGDRVLSINELRAYWARLKAIDGPIGAALRVHLLTGAQRPSQLVRATRSDLGSGGLILYDGKGRRAEPRKHHVPLITPARHDLVSMTAGEGSYLVSVDGGESPVHRSTLHKHVRRIARAMVDAGEAVSLFSIADLRRSVETRLAEAGIEKEVRCQLHSHGLSGVQDNHYNRYDFMSKKAEALDILYSLLGEDSASTSLSPAEAG